MSRTRTINLPEELCSVAEQKFLHRFGNLEVFVTTLLREMVRDDAVLMNEQEQHVVEERLKGLGYI